MANAVGRRRTVSRESARLGWGLTAPAAVLMIVFVAYPLVLGLSMSVHSVNYGLNTPERFVGARNYIDVMTNPDTLAAVVHTAGYWVVSVAIELGVALPAALALNRPFRGRGLILALVILPWALPAVVSGLLWSRILDPSTGFLNSALVQLGIFSAYKVWFSSPVWSVALISLVQAWTVAPLTTLILLGGLQGIPEELHQAAAVDGASGLERFRHITLPLLRPSIAISLTVGTVVAFGIFDVIFVLNGTALESRSLMMQVYLTTFENLDFGQGVALAFLITGLTGIAAIAYLLSFRRATR